MMLKKIIFNLLCFVLVDSYIIGNSNNNVNHIQSSEEYNNINDELNKAEPSKIDKEENAANIFNGVYTECFLYLSFSCIQKRTLIYLQKLNDLNEVTVIGDYLKFVKTNTTATDKKETFSLTGTNESSENLALMIDNTLDTFFDDHVLRFKALGRDITIPRTVNEFVGRKKRKGGGGDGGGGGHGHDHDMKKKMMMMGMMCMKMKLMVMIPAMMGMMGMMSFKGMMFSMMSFMMTKMMLLMKILEKKGSLGGGGGDAGWAAGGGGGGAWMPAGGPDYSGGGGGGGGGYDANGQWQARSLQKDLMENEYNEPQISYIIPNIRIDNSKQAFTALKDINDEVIKINNENSLNNADEQHKPKSRRKRGIVDILHSAYLYWINKLLGPNRFNKYNIPAYPKYKIINGIKYVYSPIRNVKPTATKVVQQDTANAIKPTEGFKPIVMMEDYNKGEIVDVAESRMHKKKLQDMKQTFDMAVEDNPWQ